MVGSAISAREPRERQPARVEGQQVGEVGDGQQQRGRVGQVRAGVDVRLGARAHPRGRGEDDRREQHHGRVEAEQRRDHGGGGEDVGQQPARASPRAAGHDRRRRPSNSPSRRHPSASTQQRRQEADRRREVAQRVAGGRCADRAHGHQEQGAGACHHRLGQVPRPGDGRSQRPRQGHQCQRERQAVRHAAPPRHELVAGPRMEHGDRTVAGFVRRAGRDPRGLTRLATVRSREGSGHGGCDDVRKGANRRSERFGRD